MIKRIYDLGDYLCQIKLENAGTTLGFWKTLVFNSQCQALEIKKVSFHKETMDECVPMK